jgi:hypothetical protein
MDRTTDRRFGRRRRSSVVGALILILLGGTFLLRDAGVLNLANQLGGLLVLIPAAALLISAVLAAVSGRFRPAVVRGLAGLVLAGVSAVLLFGWDLGQYWSLLLVGAGILLLGPALLTKTSDQPSGDGRSQGT